MKNEKLYKIIVAAMMAALACVATMIIRIPSPMQGYVNLGDAVVLMCGWILGPIYGVAAAGIGSMLADILAAYPHYAPGTLVIKAVVALIAYVLFTALRRGKEQNTKNLILPLVISGIAGEIAMVVLYFVYASLLLGKGWAAAASIPGNLMQGLVGIIVGAALYVLISKSKALPHLFKEKYRYIPKGAVTGSFLACFIRILQGRRL